jgi:hypothetical protein
MMMRSGRMKSSTAAPSLRKLRVADDGEVHADAAFGQHLLHRRAHPVGGADRHRALVDDDLVVGHVLADAARGGQHVLEIGRSVLVGRRADADELQRPVMHRGDDVGGELQPAIGGIALTICARPGSWIGMPPLLRISILRSSTSRQSTWLPISDRQRR